MLTNIPIILASAIEEVSPPFIWMGGGEVDLKLRFDVAELVEKFAPAGRPLEFADVTE